MLRIALLKNLKKEIYNGVDIMKRFWIYWGDNNISCFNLKSKVQAESIAKQYKNVIKIEEKTS